VCTMSKLELSSPHEIFCIVHAMNKTTELGKSKLYYTNIKETELMLLVSEHLHKSMRD
jgi:hypothetical protein